MFHEDTASTTVEASRNRVALAGDASSVMHAYSVIPGFAARLSPAALDALRRNPEVAYIEADRTFTAQATIQTIHPAPSDGNDRTDQCSGADSRYDDHDQPGGRSHVYIIDTGIRTTHTEFTGRVGNGFTSVNDGNGVEDCQGHGTHVASLAVGTQYGMAKQAVVHPVRVLSCQGSGTTSAVIAGVDFVRTDCPSQGGPCVANMSLGGGASAAMDSAVSNAIASGVPFVVSAGSGDACNFSPGRVPEAITVSASDDAGCPATFGGFGTCVDIFAPGQSILGAVASTDTAAQTFSGNSMSAGLTTGAIAMHLSASAGITPAQAAAAMMAASVPSCDCTIQRLYNDFSNPISCPTCGPPPEESCEGRCGSFDSSKPCQCDSACTSFGDCCVDKVELCG
jgi:hypothetical protein